MTKVSIKIKNQQLKRVLSIQYPMKFKKSHTEVQVLINFDNEVNRMIPTYATILKLCVCSINIEA